MMNALTRELYQWLLDLLRKEPLPFIAWQEFKKKDGSAEVIIQFHRGSKEYFHNAGHFWFIVILTEIRNGIPADSAWFLRAMLSDKNTLHKEINDEEFNKMVQWYDVVEQEHNFSLHGQFQRAWLLYDHGTETAVLAETESEFVAFSWELLD